MTCLCFGMGNKIWCHRLSSNHEIFFALANKCYPLLIWFFSMKLSYLESCLKKVISAQAASAMIICVSGGSILG